MWAVYSALTRIWMGVMAVTAGAYAALQGTAT